MTVREAESNRSVGSNVASHAIASRHVTSLTETHEEPSPTGFQALD